MPIIQSAKKRMRQATKRQARNNITRNNLRTAIKDLNNAVESGSKDTQKLLAKVYSAIDTSVKKNLMHKNKAARLKKQHSAKVKSASVTKSPANKTATKKPTAKKTTVKKAPAKKTAAKKAPAKKTATKKTTAKK